MNDNIRITEFQLAERHKQFMREAEHERLVKLAQEPRIRRIEALQCWFSAMVLRLRPSKTLHSAPCAAA